VVNYDNGFTYNIKRLLLVVEYNIDFIPGGASQKHRESSLATSVTWVVSYIVKLYCYLTLLLSAKFFRCSSASLLSLKLILCFKSIVFILKSFFRLSSKLRYTLDNDSLWKLFLNGDKGLRVLMGELLTEYTDFLTSSYSSSEIIFTNSSLTSSASLSVKWVT
jgi:hypothetical protein